MKVLLINPHLTPEDRYGKDLGKVGPCTEPLGLAYLAASLIKNNHKVRILDSGALGYAINDIKKELLKEKYDLIGITFLTPMYLRAKEVINLIKKLKLKSKIIVGGPHPTIFPKQTIKELKQIDFLAAGEGEETIVELCNALEKNKSLSKIKGLLYRKNKKIITNKPRPFIKDLDKLPLPARSLLPMKNYKPAPTYYKKLPSYVIMTSRGCPYRCSYCSKIAGRIYRYHSVKRIIKEINLLIKKYGAKEIIFRDDTFGIHKEHTIKLCKELIRLGINKKIKWTCMTRVNLVNYNLLKLMKKAGCWSIHYGIESGSQRLIDLIQKDITIKQAKNAIKYTRKAGIETKAFFMLGLPTESKKDSLQTIKFTKELDSDWIQVTLTVPYPGTKLFELAQKDGTLKSFNWENYQTWAGWSDKDLVFIPKGRNEKELKKLQTRAMREFYLRPKTILRLGLQLRSLSMFKNYFNGAYALIKSKFK